MPDPLEELQQTIRDAMKKMDRMIEQRRNTTGCRDKKDHQGHGTIWWEGHDTALREVVELSEPKQSGRWKPDSLDALETEIREDAGGANYGYAILTLINEIRELKERL